MVDRHWKRVEREVAKMVKGKRIPLSGRSNMGKVGDVELERFDVEVKSGKQVPKAVMTWLKTIQDQREPGKLPVLVMRPYKAQDEIAVMSMKDFSYLMLSLIDDGEPLVVSQLSQSERTGKRDWSPG